MVRKPWTIDQYRRRGGAARIFIFTAVGNATDLLPIPGVDGAIVKPFEVDAMLEAVAWATTSGRPVVPR